MRLSMHSSGAMLGMELRVASAGSLLHECAKCNSCCT